MKGAERASVFSEGHEKDHLSLGQPGIVEGSENHALIMVFPSYGYL